MFPLSAELKCNSERERSFRDRPAVPGGATLGGGFGYTSTSRAALRMLGAGLGGQEQKKRVRHRNKLQWLRNRQSLNCVVRNTLAYSSTKAVRLFLAPSIRRGIGRGGPPYSQLMLVHRACSSLPRTAHTGCVHGHYSEALHLLAAVEAGLSEKARQQSRNSPTVTYFTRSVSPLRHLPKSSLYALKECRTLLFAR